VDAGIAASNNVTAYTLDHDKYTHILGDVIISDGMHLNQELVKQGWWYRKYAPGDRGAGRAGEGSTRGEERLVGRSAAGAAVGMVEAQQVSGAWRFDFFLTLLSPQLTPYCS